MGSASETWAGSVDPLRAALGAMFAAQDVNLTLPPHEAH